MYPHTARAQQDYLFPLGRSTIPIHHDLQLELAGLRHEELLKEQALLQRFARTNPLPRDTINRDRSFASAYEREVRSKQQRIADMLRGDAVMGSQQQKMRRLLLEQQMNYHKMLQQMQIDHYYLLNNRKTSRLNSYKPRSNIFATLDNNFSNMKTDKNMSVDQRNRSINRNKLSETSQGINIKEKRVEDKKEKLLKQYERNSWSNQSATKPQDHQLSQLENQQQIKLKQMKKDVKHRQSLQLDNKRSNSAVQHKYKNRVSFDLASNIISDQHSLEQKSQILKSNQTQYHFQQPSQPKDQNNLKNNAQRKIQNRIRVSATIYRDSQLRNIKHEVIHLLNTYQNEVKLRHGLKTRINNEPKVIDKYSIVVEKL